VERGAHVIRTHDVAETRDAALVGELFARRPVRDDAVGVEELDVATVGDAERHCERIGVAGDAAQQAVVRVFELSGLSPTQRDRLATHAPANGAIYAPGEGSSDLLVGSPAALRALASEFDTEDALGPALTSITDALDC
ncbi:MAG: dihydropteroate synthase, partial [Halapricum sp.]